MSRILKTNNLSIGYKKDILLSGLNLSLSNGEVTAMIGRNGAGKSTLIKTLFGSLPTLGGTINIKGKVSQQYSRKELSQIMALVNTESNLAGGLRLEELVAMGRIPYTGRMGILSKNDKEIINHSLEMTGISHKKDNFMSQLSDGERQKGMIARGLAQQTPIIIMDEPFSYLDVASRIEMMELMKTLARETQIAILYSTHEVTEALKMADKIWLFSQNGVREGTPWEQIESGEIDNIFLNSRVKFDKEKFEFYLVKN